MRYTIAFVGNPNVGKSAWINALSDAGFKVGNWPGVSVERKEAEVTWGEDTYDLIDLPGCYSLAGVNEEAITATFLQKEHVDLIVNVVDASSLQRNLYLTLLLRELQIPMVVIFNFMDIVKKYHIEINYVALSRRLQLPILPVSAMCQEDQIIVKKEIVRLIGSAGFYYPLLSNEEVEHYVALYNYVEAQLPYHITMSEQQLHCFTFALLQGDAMCNAQVESWHMDVDRIKELRAGINAQRVDMSRYHVIEQLMRYVKQGDHKQMEITRRIDAVLLHRYVGLPIFFILFALLLLIVFQTSTPFNQFIHFLINDILRSYVLAACQFLPVSLQALLTDGVLAGVGGVLTFVPLMAMLYLMLSILEESGYMSRIAFLLDRMMHVFHLSGKSFVALLLGFGCNVPAIYAARTLDHEQQRRLTAFLVPFMSCGARLPVYVLFASAFFQGKAAVMIMSIYGIGILLALLLALLLSRFPAFQEDGIFVMELPSYHIPRASVVWHKVKEEVKAYVRKACGIVLWAMIILWGISYFPDGNISTSYMARAATVLAPIYEPVGFGDRWECVAALPGSIVAKETIVGYFTSILNGESNSLTPSIDPMKDLNRIKDEAIATLKHSVQDTLFPNVHLQAESDQQVSAVRSLWRDEKAELKAFCFMVYVLLSIPCIMTLQALYHEYGIKLLLLSIASMIILPYLITFLIYQGFSILFF